ncbi:WD40-repeat-containing domain protein [Flammula alnicola]|nr:WD40-repeat-containing domain protein [Flammula alnicola]
MEASTSSGILGVRKRVDSGGEGSFLSISRDKRPRLSAMAMPSSYGAPNSIGFGADRLPRPRSLFDDEGNSSMSSSFYFSPMRHARPMSGSSFTTASRAGSPFISEITGAPIGAEYYHKGRALMRSASSSSLYSPAVQVYPETSAKHFLRHARMTFDYSPPDPANEISARILSCSVNNVAFFTRGIARGNIRAIECGGKTQPDILALGSSKGYIQIWDIKAKKATLTWPTTKEITALAWNGPILSVGGSKGSIRHYDTRLPASKMKEQTRKVTRQQRQITCLQWNEDGKFLASGDATGIVYCWELGHTVPLDVGEFVSRRKKIQHGGKITAIGWSPWQSKLLATGDAKGILRLWNTNAKDSNSNALNPGKLDIGAIITGIHFSPQCKEILTTHGAQIGDPPTIVDKNQSPKPSPQNALVVHSFPSLRYVTTHRLPDEQEGPIGDSVLDGSGTKVIFATPSHRKIDVCDVWSKRKEVKRHSSFSEYGSLLIR